MMFKRSDLIISVIIPSFNRASFLRSSLESLLGQTFPKDKFEIIVVDNMSTDDSKEVFDEFSKKASKCGLFVRFIREEQKGLIFTRHTGARAARAPLLAYIDDDCVCSKGWLSAIVKAFRDFNADAVAGKIQIQWDTDPPGWVKEYEAWFGKIDYGPDRRLIRPDETIHGGNFCIRRDKLFQCGGFNPDQVGDYLVGDGETGLVNKMKDRGWKIVWAPDAKVNHCQIVSKNARMNDMRRRHFNQGIASAYVRFRKTNPDRYALPLVRQILRDALLFLTTVARFVYASVHLAYGLKKNRRPTWRFYEFNSMLMLGRLKSNCKFFLDRAARESARRNDWIKE